MSASLPLTEPPLFPPSVAVLVSVLLLWFLFRHGLRLLGWLLALAVVVSLWPGSTFSVALAPVFDGLLGPLLTLALMGVGLRIMLRPFTRCADCGCRRCDCHCHHHCRRGRGWW